MQKFDVTLTKTYTIRAAGETEAIAKAKKAHALDQQIMGDFFTYDRVELAYRGAEREVYEDC
jgi:hypothetical protein